MGFLQCVSSCYSSSFSPIILTTTLLLLLFYYVNIRSTDVVGAHCLRYFRWKIKILSLFYQYYKHARNCYYGHFKFKTKHFNPAASLVASTPFHSFIASSTFVAECECVDVFVCRRWRVQTQTDKNVRGTYECIANSEQTFANRFSLNSMVLTIEDRTRLITSFALLCICAFFVQIF